MNRFFFSVMWASVFFIACSGGPGKQVLTPQAPPESLERPEPYTVTDYKNKATDGAIPEWVSVFYDFGVSGVEALGAYEDRFVFVSRNEGINFRALNLWLEGFSAEQDFPRLAAERIGARYSSGISRPDEEYGSFYQTLVRSVSDSFWRGAVKNDDFWILREFIRGEEETGAPGPDYLPQEDEYDYYTPDTATGPQETESWEFLILVTIEKTLFASQLDMIYRNMNSLPLPSRDQTAAAGRVRDRFYEGF